MSAVEHIDLQVFEPRCDSVGRPLPGEPFRALATHAPTGRMALRRAGTQLGAIQRALAALHAYVDEERSAG